MIFPIVLAHGAFGSWDEIALFGVGVIIIGYLVALYVSERRRKKDKPGVEAHEKGAPDID